MSYTKLSDNGQRVFDARYAGRDEEGKIIESFEQAVSRLARTAAGAEKENQAKWEEKFSRVIGELLFVPSTPIWANMGKADRPWQPGACFVLGLEDSLHSMYETLYNTAMIFKSGGGTGYNFSTIRPGGDLVRSTKGKASGVVELLKLYNASAEMVMQGGVRRGASMAILNVDHPEIIDFINSKLDGGLTNFNISVGISNSFMEAVLEDGQWPLKFNGKVYEVVQALDVWNMIINAAYTCGDPGIIFLDRLQENNPVPSKVIDATNPCFHKDTLIATANGLESIEELCCRMQDEEFLVATDMRVLGGVKVVNGRDYLLPGVQMRKARVIKTGIKPTVKVTLTNGQEINVTSDHKLLTALGWIEAGNLKQGDWVFVQSGPGSFALEDNIGKELGWILGWLTGDGWLTKDDVAGMCFGKDDEHLISFFQEAVEKCKGGYRKANRRENGTYQLLWKRKDFISRIKELGIKNVKSSEKRVPKAIFTASEETVIAFLQALFSADGTVNYGSEKHRDVRLCSTSKGLLQDTQLLLLNLGIFSNIYKRNKQYQQSFEYRTKQGELHVYNSKPYYELIINGDNILDFKEKIGFKLHLGKEQKLIAIARKSRKSTKFIAKVMSVEPSESVEVYDIVQPDTRSLIANGVVAHNCGEQPLSPGESCLLGSINLARMVGDDGTVDWNLIEDTVYTAIRFLDNLIDVAEYPLSFVEQETKATRKVGLGYTAVHDALIKARLPYDSEEGRQFAGRLAESVQHAAHQASQELGVEKGVFPEWERSIFYARDEKRRNAATTTIAPTGSVTAMAGCEGYGIEPIFAIAYSKETNVAGSFEVFSPLFLDACKEYSVPSEILSEVAKKGSCEGIEGVPEDISRVFKGAQDILPEDHILMQATIQNRVDNAVSKTINLPNSANFEDISNCYRMAFELGLKGITVFRDGCKEGTITVGEKKQREPAELKRGDIMSRPESAMGITHRLDSGCGKIYLTVNYRHENGEILETFITTGSDGGCLVYTEATSRLVSLAIRGGISVDKIIEQLQSTHSCPSYQMARGKGKMVSPGKSCASAIAKKLGEVKSQLDHKCNGDRCVTDLTKPVHKDKEVSGIYNCEICGLKMERAEGCFVCRNCGFSKC